MKSNLPLKISGLLLIGSLAFFACKQAPVDQSETAVHTNLVGLATPIQLQNQSTEIPTSDYFLDPSAIDSLALPEGISGELSQDKKKLSLTPSENTPPLSSMTFFVDGSTHDVLLKASGKKTIRMSLPDNGYQKVQIKGEMNAWNPASANMTKTDDTWEFTFELNPGNYQYLFITDGREMKDPNNPTTVSNGIGGFNSLLEIPRPDPDKVPRLFALGQENDNVRIGFTNEPSEIFVYWQNQRLETKKAGDHFLATIPPAASGMKRSHIRAWSYNETGLSNNVLIPLEGNQILSKAKQLNRFDKEAQIMYFTLVDRFHNGNTQNDDPVEDDRLTPLTNYHGGDIAGITAKIKDGYFKKFNINSIWLSPITQNPLEAYQEYPEPRRWYSGYHGYWPIFSSKVDHRFGSREEMKELVKVAHENGISILLDYVCNHVHEKHPIYQNHPEWATQFDLPNGRKNIRIWEEQRLTTWFDDFLPSLDLSNPEVIELQTDSTMYWILEYGLDGFRHDATKHIPEAFWRTLTHKLKEQVIVGQGRSIYQIGETYGSRPLIQSYIGTGMLDAQFDFNLYFDAREVFARPETSFDIIARSMEETFNYYGYHSSMGYITGNHDQARFTSLAGGDLRFDEDPREAAFSRDVGVGDTIGYHRMLMQHAFNMSIPGVPVIYYGDEIGMPGAGDPDSRRPMRFDNLSRLEAFTRNTVSQLAELRKNRLSLIYGETDFLHQEDMTFAFARSYLDEITIAVFNKSSAPQTITLEVPERFAGETLKTNFRGQLSQDGRTISLSLPPASFELLTD
jgi:cyclomaltodextrinase